MAEQVDARLQRSAFVPPSEAELLIEASAEPTPANAWKVRIAQSDGSGAPLGTRELVIETLDCTAAIDAAALAIALMIDPDAMSHAAQAAAPPAPDSTLHQPARLTRPIEPAAQFPPALPRESSHSARELRPWRPRLSLGGMVTLGVLPGVAPAVFGALRLSPPDQRWGFDLAGAYAPSEATEIRASRGVVTFSSTMGEVLGWFAPWQRGTLLLSLAAGIQTARLSATGTAFTAANRSAQSWVVSARVEAEGSWRFAERWSVFFRPGLGVPMLHDRFNATVGGQTETVFEPSPVTASLALGVGFEP
ncbi:MAG: hypothetical protein ABW061_09530 [Polyangiaceae bacterium]